MESPINFQLFNDDYNYRISNFLDSATISRLPLTTVQIIYFDSINKIDWDILSYRDLSMRVVHLFKDKINWEIFFTNGKKKEILALYEVRDIFDKFAYILYDETYKKLYFNKEFIITFPQYVDWNWCAKNKILDECIIKRYWSKFNVDILCRNQSFSLDVASTYKYGIKWNLVKYGYTKLPEQFLMSIVNLINWKWVLKIVKISEKMIETNLLEFPKIIKTICKYQILSERFILNHYKKLDMFLISKYQLLSFEFIMSNLNIIDMEGLYQNTNYNKKDSIQICKAKDKWFLLDAPIVVGFNKINYIEESNVIRL